ncbi:MAG: LacI family DNA-binding transcriptional regulator [Lachnospiraceae bacterium]
MATMKEIAELAGVSRGTVDRVLNHRGIVNENTEKKVQEIARLLDYQPNRAGKALAAQKKKFQIGVILFGSDNPFFDEVMEGMYKKFEELSIYGCSIQERRIHFTLEAQLQAIDELVRGGIDGIILSPYNDAAIQEKIDELFEREIPCVTINTDIPHSKRIAYVGSDYYKCGETAAGLLGLITGGQALVGIVTGSHNVLCHEERIEGFMDRVQQKYPGIQVASIVENQDDEYISFNMVRRLLKNNPNITALYFTAAGVHGGCQAITAMEIKSPIRVISFDAVASTKLMMREGLVTATITQQPLQQGADSLSILVDYLLTRSLPPQELNYMDLSIMIEENI